MFKLVFFKVKLTSNECTYLIHTTCWDSLRHILLLKASVFSLAVLFLPVSPVTYYSLGSGALLSAAASSQCGGWGMGGGMVGADQPAVLAPFPSFGRAKVTWSSKTPK